MGGCVSSHEHQHHHKRQQHDAGSRPSGTRRIAKGAAPYDSVASVLAHDEHQQQQPGIEDSAGHGGGASPEQGPSRKRRPAPRAPKFDLATGDLIPDFGVHGVFDVLHELGSGGSGQTYLCRDMASGKVAAVKFVQRPLSKEAIPFMMGEVEVQAKLGEGSLNIISLHEIILTRTHLALVMEYASGGCLTSQVSCLWESALSRGGLFMAEQESSYYMRQFVAAMAYCHRNRVAHRDLKLDNTLLEEQLIGPPRLKLCDFGFAKQWSGDSSLMHTAIGTPVYMSPQMLAARQCASGYSGVKADIWAAGILLFVMLLGTFPFDHDPKHDPNSSEAAGEVWLKQQQGSWRKHPRAAEVLGRGVLSSECCDLLDGLLDMNEERRIGTEELVSHPWLFLELNPEQQAAWESLQAEQQQLTQHLAHARDPHLAKLRKEAMLAMMAFAAKAPSAALFPGPNGAYSAAPASAAAAAGNGAVSHGLALVGSSSSATPSLEIAGASSALQDASSLPGSPAVASPVGSPGAASSVAAAAAASPAGSAATMNHNHHQQQQPSVLSSLDDTASSPDATAAAAAAGAASPAPDLHSAPAAALDAADEAGEGLDSFVVCDGDVLNPPAFDFARHFSFQKGEGLRSGSLEEKVDRYRQQASELRNARLAAMIAQQQQQGAAAAGGGGGAAATAAAAAGVASGRRSTDSVGSSGSAADQAASPAVADGPAAADTLSSPRDTVHKQQQHRGLMAALKRKDAASAAGTAAVPNAAKHSASTGISSGSSSGPATEQQQQQHRKKKRFIKSPFAGSFNKAAAAAISADGSGATKAADADDIGAEAADEVWRLPLSSTVDPAVFKLRPELAVAAGALVRQLQGSGKVPGRGRTNRSSCPM